MAQITESGRGRATNVDLNLVPFIDLMSVLITFLLITAVWSQISMIQLNTTFGSSNPNLPSEPKIDDFILQLDVLATGYILKAGTEVVNLPKLEEGYDTKSLIDELTNIKNSHPDKTTLKIALSDEIAYQHMIDAMDSGLKVGLAPELLTGAPR